MTTVADEAETPPAAPHPDERGAQAVGADAVPPPPYDDVPGFEMDDFRKDAGRFTPTPRCGTRTGRPLASRPAASLRHNKTRGHRARQNPPAPRPPWAGRPTAVAPGGPG